MLARLSSRRIAVRSLPMRTYTTSVKDGSVASSREFGKKEKAHEDQYARKHEREQLEKLKKEIDAKKAELAELEKQHQSAAAEASKDS
ncbi:hypothetical protein FA95DRAFT_1601824 [Auriscalpium vulgare]|uniref:Uncharacterized protein n=1 Tax=Auriscalpium vulgare TaxID=40419 RepID=A0ACB8S932_9AGAM|nr:hypothetical protein FA95DRAFT_1601824 [Auriscalpium vulgare]